MGTTEVIREGRLTSGTLIAILRLTGTAAAGLPAFSDPFLFAVAAAAFLLLTVVPTILLLLTFFVAPLVDFLVADILAGLRLLAVVAAFFTVFFLLAVEVAFLTVFFVLPLVVDFLAVFFLLAVAAGFFFETAF